MKLMENDEPRPVPPPVVLGKKYRDRVSGFTGMATARTEHLFGCLRILLEGAGEGGKPEEFWFDELRLDGVDDQPVETSGKPGGPRPAPPRTGLRP